MKTDFNDRLNAALAEHGIDNADFASRFGERGQQLVHGWRKRGRIGGKSVAAVRRVLPRTSMEWLNEGIQVPNPERNNGVTESHPARLDRATIRLAIDVLLLRFAEANEVLALENEVELFALAYEWVSDRGNASKQAALSAAVAQRLQQGVAQGGRVDAAVGAKQGRTRRR